jgi:hypothetical protein
MSKILKRPMFRIGGQANEEGIISMAQPRKNYQEGSDYQKRIEELRPIFQAAAGQGRSQNDRLSDLLISGGLNLMSARPSGNIFSTAAGAFKEPTSQYLKGRETEDAFQRQINLAAATQGITSVDAERLARLKVKQEGENEEVVTLTKLLQLSGVQNPYAVAKTQIDFKKRHGEDISTTPVNRDEKGKLSARQLAGISPGQVFLINDPKSGLITARKTDEAGNYKLIDPLTNKEKIPPTVTPPKTYSEIISQNPLSIRRNTLMQQYLKKEQEKKKNTSNFGD